MKLSRERLLREAGTTGFRPESLEKVIRLVSLLNGIFRHADLRERLVLKGGTALNLFLFDVPRLSVDIDLNYIGSADRSVMDAERPALASKLQAVFEADDFSVRRMRAFRSTTLGPEASPEGPAVPEVEPVPRAGPRWRSGHPPARNMRSGPAPARARPSPRSASAHP